ncbi:MAG: hypothetical protein LBI27_06040 [Clostridiales bacterium]|jgi:stage III sporulation protein AG|nr:hypothetical protein [Clostridiales bacterium]
MNFRKLPIKNTKLIMIFAAFIAVGAMFLVLERVFAPEENRETVESPTPPQENFAPATQENFRNEEILENRLAEFFTMVEGAGKVRVMVSPLSGRETVFATNVNETHSQTTEQDSQGGSRETRNYSNNEQIVIFTDRQGTSTPLVLRETEPRIEGIVIIAEGGDNPFVRDALTRAARAVLGLEAHMIQVLKMEINQ